VPGDTQPRGRARETARGSAAIRQALTGSLAALVLVVVLGAAMFPLRSHLSVATSALVLVVPVVVGAALGGFSAGIVGTAIGFFVYDFVFVPPYYTLSVGGAQNWAALGVFVVVTVVISQMVVRLNVARADARIRAAEVRRLFDLSDLFVRESSLPDLLVTIVTAVRQAFELDGAALLLPVGGQLELVASVGAPLSESELRQLSASPGVPVSLETGAEQGQGVRAVALVASDQAIGLLALKGLRGASGDRELFRAFTNHLALALERAQLQERAVRAQLLEEVDRLRRSLVGAVSHDLRTPLATIKVSASTLLDPEVPVTDADAHELLGLIDAQADRLDRLVSNLLDMTRIQSGSLELRRRPVVMGDLVEEALSVLGRSADLQRVTWQAPPDLPPVDVDHVLIRQVLANLIDNATRYAPDNTDVTVSARRRHDGEVEVSVSDEGPGVPADERATIFQMFNRREAGGRGGLGLAIARAFVEAHGQRIWVDDGGEPGARFVFTLPTAGPAPSTSATGAS
jgi:two-component system sensor histidine kinase KdpD